MTVKIENYPSSRDKIVKVETRVVSNKESVISHYESYGWERSTGIRSTTAKGFPGKQSCIESGLRSRRIKMANYNSMPGYEPENNRHLAVWFNPYIPKHVEAWTHVQKKGFWPQEFQAIMEAEGVIIHEGWNVLIESKLARCWINHILKCATENEE